MFETEMDELTKRCKTRLPNTELKELIFIKVGERTPVQNV